MPELPDQNVFTDLSGVPVPASGNPYNAILKGCDQDPREIQKRYATHREARNEQQKSKLLASDFAGFNIDTTLAKLLDPATNAGYVDPRNCLVFWARPPQRIRQAIGEIQTHLLSNFPTLWLMPLEDLHLTVLEMTHSKIWPEIAKLVDMMDSKIPEITAYTQTHRARLVKPTISYDSAAIALSFLPAAGEPTSEGKACTDDTYSYHHLRRDMFELCQSTGVEVASRYVVPSSHLTIARFVNQNVFEEGKVGEFVHMIERINAELYHGYWPPDESGMGTREPLSWVVGEEKGLVCRKGTVWYGGGESHFEGPGI